MFVKRNSWIVNRRQWWEHAARACWFRRLGEVTFGRKRERSAGRRSQHARRVRSPERILPRPRCIVSRYDERRSRSWWIGGSAGDAKQNAASPPILASSMGLLDPPLPRLSCSCRCFLRSFSTLSARHDVARPGWRGVERLLSLPEACSPWRVAGGSFRSWMFPGPFLGSHAW